MNRVLDYLLDDTGVIVTSVLPRSVQRRIVNTLLDGSVDIETIGLPSVQADVTVYATWAQKAALDSSADSVRTIYVEWEGSRLTCVVIEPDDIPWSRYNRGPQGNRLFEGTFKVHVSAEEVV
jgi:hypothetical protein